MDLVCYRESAEKQKNGVPIYIEDSVFIGRRFGTKESNEQLKLITKELFGPLHQKQESDFDEIFAHWLVEYGIVGWEKVTDGGVEIAYSQSVARKVFLNPEVWLSLNRILLNDLSAFENYLHDETREEIEDIKK